MASYPMSREGCTTNCVNGKLILSCPIAPAVERDLGLCNPATAFGATSLPSGSSPAAQAGTADQLMRSRPEGSGFPLHRAAQAGTADQLMRSRPEGSGFPLHRAAQAKAKTEQMRRDAFSHID